MSDHESNFRIESLESGTFVVKSDSERFGKQAITFENFSRNECVNYIDSHSESSKPSYYVIEDLSTWSTNAPIKSMLERFDELKDAIGKFNEYRLNEYDYSDGNSKLTLGAAIGMGEIDIIHVKNDFNFLITDFTGMPRFNTHKEFLENMSFIENSIGLEKVVLYKNEKGDRLKDPLTIDFKDWNNIYFDFSSETAYEKTIENEHNVILKSPMETLALKIVEFLEQNDPAFGYAEGQPGWQSQNEVISTIADFLLTENHNEWFENMFNELETPENSAEIRELRNEIYKLANSNELIEDNELEM